MRETRRACITRELTFNATLVTVQAVDLTPDFKHCHVHVGVMGTEREQRDAIHQLAERRPQIQHELSRHVILKYTPRLHFHLDTSVERGTKVMEILRQIDEVTPPESAEAAARRTDAFADGDTDELVDFDAGETDTGEFAEQEADEEPPEPPKEAEKIREPRSIRGTGGRSKNDKQASDDDE